MKNGKDGTNMMINHQFFQNWKLNLALFFENYLFGNLILCRLDSTSNQLIKLGSPKVTVMIVENLRNLTMLGFSSA